MPDINNGIALGVNPPGQVQQPDLGKMLSTYSSLQMSSAHAGLYSLEAAKQAMTIHGLQDAQSRMAAGEAPETAVQGLAAVDPERAKSFLDAESQAQNMGANRAFAASPTHDPNLLGINPLLRSQVMEASARIGLTSAETADKLQSVAQNQLKTRAQITEGAYASLNSLPPDQQQIGFTHLVTGLNKNNLLSTGEMKDEINNGFNAAAFQRWSQQGLSPPEFQTATGGTELAQGLAKNQVEQDALNRKLPQQRNLQAATGTGQGEAATAFDVAANRKAGDLSGAIPFLRQSAALTAQGEGEGKLVTAQPLAQATATGAGAGQNATELAAIAAGIPGARAKQIGTGTGEAANATEAASILANLPGAKAGQIAAATGAAGNATELAAIAAGIPGARARQIGMGTGEAANATEAAAIAANLPGAKAQQIATGTGKGEAATAFDVAMARAGGTAAGEQPYLYGNAALKASGEGAGQLQTAQALARAKTLGENQGQLPDAEELARLKASGESQGKLPAAIQEMVARNQLEVSAQTGKPTDAIGSAIAAGRAMQPLSQAQQILANTAKRIIGIPAGDARNAAWKSAMDGLKGANSIDDATHSKYVDDASDSTLKGLISPPLPSTPKLVPGLTAEETARAKAMGDATVGDVKKSADEYSSAQSLMMRLDTIDHDIDTLGPQLMGAGSAQKMQFMKGWNAVADGVGAGDGAHFDPTKLGAYESFSKETKRAGMELIKSNFGGAREAASIIQMGTTAVPGSDSTALGAKINSQNIRSATHYAMDLHDFKMDIVNGRPPTPDAVKSGDGKNWLIPDPDNAGKTITTSATNTLDSERAFSRIHKPYDYAMLGIANGAIPKEAVGELIDKQNDPNAIISFDRHFGEDTRKFILENPAAEPLRQTVRPQR